jgi:hypothetical protein
MVPAVLLEEAARWALASGMPLVSFADSGRSDDAPSLQWVYAGLLNGVKRNAAIAAA